jgi:hypothetical protein
MRYGPTSAIVVACVLAILGLCHLFVPDLAWQLYRRPQPYPDDSGRFTLRLLGAAMLAFAVLVGTVVYAFF